MTTPSLSYCGKELRAQDHDRFLTCLFAPSHLRDDLFTLYAFNLEVAKTAEVVSEAMLGRIRLQWWRESLDGIYDGAPRKHAVVEPLASVVSRHRLPRDRFDVIVDGRELDLEEEPPSDLAALEAYAASTSGALTQLAAMVLGTEDKTALQSANHVGIAWAMIGLLRAVPFHAARKRNFLPADLSDRHTLRLGDLFELRPSDALAAVTKDIAQRASWHLNEAGKHGKSYRRATVAAVLPAIIARRHLKSLERAGWNPLDPAVQDNSHGQAWRLFLGYLFVRF
ncbi:phytoene/squalene synthase family protein [Pelagibius sp. Alg239-R121]|uniref:phytoene/squalene synthase family protein n=1 Tax=Pelagibius sp. Alg239-R121 TaxID=2993448 RepID=UPI0024A77A60|nr:phytoene/squalene synthase family protein [Pelagibius sp. Alg239-R121]